MEKLFNYLSKVFTAKQRTTKNGLDLIEIPCWKGKYGGYNVAAPKDLEYWVSIEQNKNKNKESHPDCYIIIKPKKKQYGNPAQGWGGNDANKYAKDQGNFGNAKVFGPSNPCKEYQDFMNETPDPDQEIPF